MKMGHRVILLIYSIFIAVISFIVMILPFDIDTIFGIRDGVMFIESVRGNYVYSLLGLIVLVLSIVYLISIFKNKDNKKLGSFLVLRNEYGEILIYEETIIGLVDNIAQRFTGIKNIKTKVNFIEGQVSLSLKGEATSEINIPETSKELQLKVKEHIEEATGANVKDIKVEIINVTTPMNSIKQR